MIIQRDERFDKLLNNMRNAGGNAALAARNAVQVIDTLQKKEAAVFRKAGRRTKYGEKRLKNCLKFNLGNGYRLISVRMQNSIHLLYLGTHDECDVWLEKNRGRSFWEADHDRKRTEFLSEPTENTRDREQQKDEYEELLMSKIDDRMLRRLFSGLLKNTNKPNR